MKTMTHTAPITVIKPEMIHVEKSIDIWPNTASQTSHGMSMSTTSARPQTVYATRSEAPSRRRIGTSETTTSEMPSMRAVAASATAPFTAMNAPSARPSTARTQRRLALRARRLGEIADRSRDRHHAHAPGGDGNDDERQQHPDGESDDEAASP